MLPRLQVLRRLGHRGTGLGGAAAGQVHAEGLSGVRGTPSLRRGARRRQRGAAR